MLPLARELVRRGGRVVIAANEVPSINDITAAEAHGVLVSAAQGDGVVREALADGRRAPSRHRRRPRLPRFAPSTCRIVKTGGCARTFQRQPRRERPPILIESDKISQNLTESNSI